MNSGRRPNMWTGNGVTSFLVAVTIAALVLFVIVAATGGR